MKTYIENCKCRTQFDHKIMKKHQASLFIYSLSKLIIFHHFYAKEQFGDGECHSFVNYWPSLEVLGKKQKQSSQKVVLKFHALYQLNQVTLMKNQYEKCQQDVNNTSDRIDIENREQPSIQDQSYNFSLKFHNLTIKTNKTVQNIIIVIIFLLIILLLRFYLQNNQFQQISLEDKQINYQDNQKIKFPKILWVHSYIDFDSLNMPEAVIAQHQIEIGKLSGYEIRVVDHVIAYNWLSPQMTERIRKTKHRSPFFIDVNELLRLALMIQHGGVWIRAGHQILTQKLDWIDMMVSGVEKRSNQGNLISCNQISPDIILFYRTNNRILSIEDRIIISKKKSLLLRDVFDEMMQVLQTGISSYDALQIFGKINNDGVISMQNFFQKLINFRHNYWNNDNEFCQNYNVLSINNAEMTYIRQYNQWILAQSLLMMNKNKIFKFHKSKIMEFDPEIIKLNLLAIVKSQNVSTSHNQSIFREMIGVEGNKWMMIPLNRTRDVKFCLISLKPLDKQGHLQKMAKSVQLLSKQSYRQWEAVYFVTQLQVAAMVYSSNHTVTLVNASQWEGLNLQRAATKYCGQKDIGLLLDYDEVLQGTETLKRLEGHFKNKDVFSALISMKVKQKKFMPNSNMVYSRKVKAINKDSLNQIARNLRVFSLYAYRLVPHFELYDRYGRYFDREIPLNIMILLGIYDNKCETTYIKYYLKKIQRNIELPKVNIYLSQIAIISPKQKRIDFSRPEYINKPNIQTWCLGLQLYFIRLKRSISDYFYLNNGNEFQGIQNRNHLPKQIPAIIHQVWVGTKQLPHYKKLLMDKARQSHPNFQYYLWTDANITRQNFPITYDLVQTLYEFNKVSPTNKLSTICDLIRLEAIYRHGGIYIDTNYYVFKPNSLDTWLTYKAVIPAYLVPIHRSLRDSGIFGCMKGCPQFQYLLDHRLLSTRNIFYWQAVQTLGPIYYVQAFQAKEEADPEIYQPPFNEIYPWHSMGGYHNECQAPVNTPNEQLLFRNKYAYWKNCSDIYDWAYGIDFFKEGGSWIK